MKIIGVFGVSGVGKTVFIEALVAEQPRWLRISAGTLLQGRLTDVPRDALRVQRKESVFDNQEIIVDELSVWRRKIDCDAAFFDGHLLIDTDRTIVEIPYHVVQRLELDAMIFVHDDPKEIERRRARDPSRSRAMRTAQQLDVEQTQAMSLAEHYAGELQIPLFAVAHSDLSAVKDTIASIIRQ